MKMDPAARSKAGMQGTASVVAAALARLTPASIPRAAAS